VETTGNLEVIKGIYEAFSRGDIAAVLARMRADARWGFNVADSDVPWHRQATGPDEIMRSLSLFAEHCQVTRFEPRRYIASGEDVVVDVGLSYVLKKTGSPLELEQLHWWSLTDGRVARLVHFEDTAQVISAWRGRSG
jgi:ketosteroid isomerase-like protein